jgi:hypothetical protein
MPSSRSDIIKGGEHPLYFPTLKKLGQLGLRLLGKPSMAEIVEGEIRRQAEDFGKPYDHAYENYIHNFLGHLPVGHHASVMQRTGRLDLLNSSRIPVEEHGRHSRVYLRQTPRQFYQTVEKAYRDAGLDPVKVMDFEKRSSSALPNELSEIYRYVLPAYIKLREWGYTHGELIH